MALHSSISILSPERRIELNCFDVDAWNLLLREAQTRTIEHSRNFYERLVTQFPNAGRFWKAYIEHELRARNFEKVEEIFKRCLPNVLHIDLWKCYLFYVRETKGHMKSFREEMARAYDFALERIGLDVNSYQCYAEYISFLKSAEVVGQYAENQKITAVRKIFRKGLTTPMANIEQLWSEYCNFEKSVNPALADKMINDASRDYQLSRKVMMQRQPMGLEMVTRGINRNQISIPPRGTAAELKQAELWRQYIEWEKRNPLNTDDYGLLARRVNYTYEQALLCLGYLPDIWYEAALFQQQAVQILAEKGDVKLSNIMLNETIQLYERGISGLMRDSELLHFAYADFEEERRKFDSAMKIYERILSRDTIDHTLIFIQLMKFIRRTQGVKEARLVFKRAREDKGCSYHIYVAAAFMEYYCSKDPQVAKRIFELGMRIHGDDPDFALIYSDFLVHLNEDNNTRVVFERLLGSNSALPSEKSTEIWDKYLEFESQVGDLTSVLNVDQRRREALKSESRHQALWLIDRYKFINLAPCTSDQLKLMGYQIKQSRINLLQHAAPSIPTSAAIAKGASSQQQNGVGAGSSKSAAAESLAIGGGFPRPDTAHMLPFKPRLPPAPSYHPVPGGVCPPPQSIAYLLSLLPPPTTFHGPFVDVDELLGSLASFNRELPSSKLADHEGRVGLDPSTTFDGGQTGSDIKREFYQLLTTTMDPIAIIGSQEYTQTQPSLQSGTGLAQRKRMYDSDSDDEGGKGIKSGIIPCSDIYKRRMHAKTTEIS